MNTIIAFFILSLPITYKYTSKLCNKSPIIQVILHTSIFTFIIYALSKITENFNFCDPGYIPNNTEDAYNNPFKSWCIYGNKKKEDEKESDGYFDDDDEDSILRILKNQDQNNSCSDKPKVGKDDEVYEDRSSWCTMKDKM